MTLRERDSHREREIREFCILCLKVDRLWVVYVSVNEAFDTCACVGICMCINGSLLEWRQFISEAVLQPMIKPF